MGNWVKGTACTTATCGVTNTSPEFNLKRNPNMTINGVLYQPRGAWLINDGGIAVSKSPLQIISGSLIFDGDARLALLAPTKPAIIFRTALIQ